MTRKPQAAAKGNPYSSYSSALAGSGAKDVVVAPIGFTSDHMEVLYDLDLEARSPAIELGLNMVRAATVGTHPRFERVVRELVEERLSGAPCASTSARAALSRGEASLQPRFMCLSRNSMTVCHVGV